MKTFFYSTKKPALILSLILLFLTGCQTFEGQYTSPNEVRILDDKWNDTDSRKTSEQLVSSMLKKPWLTRFIATKKTRPIVIVDEISNESHEHIDTKAITSSIRNELINSGKVRFLNAKQRTKIIKEIKYQNQSGMVDPAKAKKAGKQFGAGFMLSGRMNSFTHQHQDANFKTIAYQVDLILTNLETAEIEWSEQYKIKKTFKHSNTRW